MCQEILQKKIHENFKYYYIYLLGNRDFVYSLNLGYYVQNIWKSTSTLYRMQIGRKIAIFWDLRKKSLENNKEDQEKYIWSKQLSYNYFSKYILYTEIYNYIQVTKQVNVLGAYIKKNMISFVKEVATLQPHFKLNGLADIFFQAPWSV